MTPTSKPILMGSGEDIEIDDSEIDIDEGAIRNAVDTVAREQGYDGYQVLPNGTIFIQSIFGKGTSREYIYPVGSGININYNHIENQNSISPEAFLIYRTSVPIDPATAQPQDIVCCPVEDNQLTRWLWSYWIVETDLDLIILDENHPQKY